MDLRDTASRLGRCRSFKLCRDILSLCRGSRKTSPDSSDAEVQATLAPGASLEAGNTAQHLVNIQIGTVNDVGGRPGRTEAVETSTPAETVAGRSAPGAEGPGGATSSQEGARQRINRPNPNQRVFVTSQGTRYHKETCGDVRRARRLNPSSIVSLPLQEAQTRGYTACGNCGG